MSDMTPPLSCIFVSHGAPSMVLEQGPTQDFLRRLGQELDRPRAIVCISAHWEGARPTVSKALRPATLYDFYGFPAPLYEMCYPASGDPRLAERVMTLLSSAGLEAVADPARGLDHGAWVPLMLMYPAADVPVIQLSVQSGLGGIHHLALGEALRPLREEGVLILGSGGATHNLREFRGQAIDTPPPEYVVAFDAWLKDAVTAGRVHALIDYLTEGPSAQRNHPTPEHFLPLLATLGAATGTRRGRVIHEAYAYGILSMAAFAWD